MSNEFEAARLTENGELVLEARPAFSEAPPEEQIEWIESAITVWKKTLSAEGKSANSGILLVEETASAGSLWSWNQGGITCLDRWSDSRVRNSEFQRSGKIFGFLGGQGLLGNGTQGTLTGRLGTLLFDGSYDAAVSLGYSTLTRFSTGVVFRKLFVLRDRFGWNVGTQINYLSQPIQGNRIQLLGLTGINLLFGRGSFDVTATLGTGPSYGLLVGYSFFLG